MNKEQAENEFQVGLRTLLEDIELGMTDRG